LYESRAIAKYLVAKYDPKNTHGLMPTEPADVEGLQACALFDQAVSVEVNNFESHALRICHERVFKPYVLQILVDHDSRAS
jgi:glutathione S-transferase